MTYDIETPIPDLLQPALEELAKLGRSQGDFLEGVNWAINNLTRRIEVEATVSLIQHLHEIEILNDEQHQEALGWVDHILQNPYWPWIPEESENEVAEPETV